MKGRLYSVVFFVALTLALVLVNGDHASASIPRIGGTWTIRGEGTWGDIAVTDDGVSIITTYIDTDG
ncbi:MAG: hypothetical protein EOM17_14490, partial [Synergistales bacterium]|nr:hypothetical protein [Synergistales bacterium]